MNRKIKYILIIASIIPLSSCRFIKKNLHKIYLKEKSKIDFTDTTKFDIAYPAEKINLKDCDFSTVFSEHDYGVFGDSMQRIDIAFTSIKKINDSTYSAKGKSREKNIVDFNGELSVENLALNNEGMYVLNNDTIYCSGIVKGYYNLNQDKNKENTGVFSGNFFIYFNSYIYPTSGHYLSHGWNEFHGKWESYTSNEINKCNWGYLLPPSEGLFSYVGNYSYKFNNKYTDKGWKTFVLAQELTQAVKNFDSDEPVEISDCEIKEAIKIEKKEWWK